MTLQCPICGASVDRIVSEGETERGYTTDVRCGRGHVASVVWPKRVNGVGDDQEATA